MSDALKVFTAETITDQPFPQEAGQLLTSNDISSGDTYQSSTISESPLPSSKTAAELIGTSLNTRSRQILAEFSFSQSGALAIGDFESGVSGDIRITPNGLVARNLNGDTTFAIDGTTGDVTLRGTILSSTVIGGVIKTSASGTRVEMNSDTNRISFYNGSAEVQRINPTGQTFYGDFAANYYYNAAGNDLLNGFGYVTGGGIDGFVLAAYGTRSLYFGVESGGIYFESSVNMQGNSFDAIGAITFETQGSDLGHQWAIYAFDDGGSYGFRTRMRGTTWQMDQTAV